MSYEFLAARRWFPPGAKILLIECTPAWIIDESERTAHRAED
jgi:hypothetical protein